MSSTSHPSTLYTIGHSNHSQERFLELLQLHGIESIADVRSSPYSRYSSQFSKEELERSLKSHSIAYLFLGRELGARREEPGCYRDGRVDYEQVVHTSSFQQGIAQLLDEASTKKIAMMCAEQDPLTCHRTILIGRHIVEQMGEVLHILPDGRLETQAEAEMRLLVECKLQHEDFFATREERLAEAYERRGANIAYEVPASHA